MRFFTFLSLLAAVLMPANAQELAWIESDRVMVHDGERTMAWPGSAGADSFCWDHQGRNLLIARSGRLQRLTRDGRRTTLVHGFKELRFPDVSSADGQIAFACTLPGSKPNDWQLRVIEKDGRGNLELGPGYDPAFLPDGSGVVFEGFDEPGPDLWVYRFDTTVRRRLFDAHRPRYTPAVSHDGKRVAFTSAGRLLLADLDGGAPRDLSPEGATYDRFATFAADDGSIAFFREQRGRTSIVLRDLAGEERVLPAGAQATLPMFRPLRTGAVIQTLTAAAAKTLVEAAGRRALVLPDLESLDAETARVLASTAGSLELDGLAQIDLATAAALSQWDGYGEKFYLSLDGLREPPPEVLAALARSKGWGLSFGRITRLTAPYLEALASFRGATVRLQGLAVLDEKAAKSVATTWNAKWIGVDFETEVPQASRTALRQGRVELRGARR